MRVHLLVQVIIIRAKNQLLVFGRKCSPMGRLPILAPLETRQGFEREEVARSIKFYEQVYIDHIVILLHHRSFVVMFCVARMFSTSMLRGFGYGTPAGYVICICLVPCR